MSKFYSDQLVIASRQSPLAMWQSEYVKKLLALRYPELNIEIKGFKTTGDKFLDRPLSQIGGKGLFTKELEMALIEGKAHLAVHSMKDIPMDLSGEFVLAATLSREIAADAFVSNNFQSLTDLPKGAVVGTSSLRRAALLRQHDPSINIMPLRGNVQTRLQKLDQGEFDAIILAAAGLVRLNLSYRIKELLNPDTWLPAPGQGVLAIETLSSFKGNESLSKLSDPLAQACVTAERAFSMQLGGSCQIPLGAYAKIENGKLFLKGFIATPDALDFFRGEASGSIDAAAHIGSDLASELIENGAKRILVANKA